MTFNALVIDDEPQFYAPLTTILEERYRASVYLSASLQDGAKTFESLKMSEPDTPIVVLLDLMLPDMVSPALLLDHIPTTWQAWREIEPEAPTIVVTQYDLDDQIVEVIRFAGDRVLDKKMWVCDGTGLGRLGRPPSEESDRLNTQLWVQLASDLATLARDRPNKVIDAVVRHLVVDTDAVSAMESTPAESTSRKTESQPASRSPEVGRLRRALTQLDGKIRCLEAQCNLAVK
jgi:CheY-like chemotaxis protein